MKISIITVTFNSERTIRQCVESVQRQSYKNIEYIIIDGASKDMTVSIIKEYPNIKLVSEPDNGIYNAMNKGIKMASGDYIQIIGSDDCLINSNILEMVAAELVRYNYPDILSTCAVCVNEDLKYEKHWGNEHCVDRNNFNGEPAPHGGMYVKSDLMKSKLFDEKYKISADYDFFLKCYYDEKCRIVYSKIETYYFALGGASGIDNRGYYEDLCIWEKYGMSPIYTWKKSWYKEFVNNLFIKLCKMFPVMCIFLKMKKFKRHKCNNYVCRWCN